MIDYITDGKNCTGGLERPSLKDLIDMPYGDNEQVLNLMKQCWAEDPQNRPTFKEINKAFHKFRYYGSLKA